MPPLDTSKEEVFKIITDPEECEFDVNKWTGTKGKDNLPKGPGVLRWDEAAFARAVKAKKEEDQKLLT